MYSHIFNDILEHNPFYLNRASELVPQKGTAVVRDNFPSLSEDQELNLPALPVAFTFSSH